MSIISIIEGNLRFATKIRTSVMVYREENFCMKCPLANEHGRYTGVCSKSKGGCNCKTGAKTSQNKIPCPKGFWGNNWVNHNKFNEFLKSI
jgi:hypothetical protein